jgi:hypothetical protein
MNEETKPVEESVEKELTEEEAETEAERIVNEMETLRVLEIALRAERQRQTKAMFHQPTKAHSHKERGVGITRKNKEQTKKARLQAKKSRTINHKIANKKSRATGSKKRI